MRSVEHYEQELWSLVSREIPTACTFTDLVRSLKGAHPTLVSDLLSSQDSSVLDRLLGNEPLRQNVLIEHQSNPTLCAWYFDRSTNDLLSGLVNWSRESVCLLGTPGVLIDACSKGHVRDAHLFDLEPPIFLASQPGVQTHAENVDLVHRADYTQRFDSIFIDAPWYIDDALRWSSIAFEWLKPMGRIFLALWPQFLRPNAIEEREQIISSFKAAGAEVQVQEQCLEYEVPSFEAGQLANRGLPFRPWKLADLLTASFPSRLASQSYSHVSCSPRSEWREIRVNGIRFFLQRLEGRVAQQEEFLVSLGDSAGILRSPSMRSARARANVLSSVGHGLSCADNSRLLKILSRVAVCGKAALSRDGSVDPSLAKMLGAVLNAMD